MTECEPFLIDSTEVVENALSTFDAILAVLVDTQGPVEVVSMLRAHADLIEAISNRRMH